MWTLAHISDSKPEPCPFGMIELKDVQDEEGNHGDGIEHECNETADHYGTRPHKCFCGHEF